MNSSRLLLTVLLLALAAFATTGLALADGDDGRVIGSGQFRGASDHVTTGGIVVRQTADGYIVELAADFSLDGAPDPKLGFGKNGYDTSTTFAPLRSNNGAQTYQVPAGIDVSQYDEFYIWCEKFSVPLGVAELK